MIPVRSQNDFSTNAYTLYITIIDCRCWGSQARAAGVTQRQILRSTCASSSRSRAQGEWSETWGAHGRYWQAITTFVVGDCVVEKLQAAGQGRCRKVAHNRQLTSVPHCHTFNNRRKAEQRKGYAKTVQGPEDEEDGEESFANEQLRKAVRRQRAQMAAAAAGGAAAAGAVGMQAGYPAGYGAGGYDASAGAALQGYASTGMADASGAAYGMAAGAGAAAGMAGHHGISAAAAARRTEAVRALGSAAVNSLQEGLKRLSTAHKNAQVCVGRSMPCIEEVLD